MKFIFILTISIIFLLNYSFTVKSDQILRLKGEYACEKTIDRVLKKISFGSLRHLNPLTSLNIEQSTLSLNQKDSYKVQLKLNEKGDKIISYSITEPYTENTLSLLTSQIKVELNEGCKFDSLEYENHFIDKNSGVGQIRQTYKITSKFCDEFEKKQLFVDSKLMCDKATFIELLNSTDSWLKRFDNNTIVSALAKCKEYAL